MDQFEEYVMKVTNWNQELKDFLEQEHISKQDGIWKRMNHFTEIIEGISRPLSSADVSKLQTEAEILHNEMEDYFSIRQQLGTSWMNEPKIPIGGHQLPQLPYAYNALEPYISEKIMKLHHDKHHRSYVDGLNKAEKELKKARDSNDFSLVKHWSRELAFHGSGHYLHMIFWSNMSPNGGGRPTGKLLNEIEADFGGFDSFKAHFTEAAKQVEGVGWAILVWSPRARRLEILQSEMHMLLTQWDTIPLLVLDVWEHAYYLQYENKRADYIKNWWKIVNWKDVSDRFDKASMLKWKPF